MKITSTFVVIRTPGPFWVTGKVMREQEGWPEHAQFMDGLATEGFVLLGGPLADTGDIMLVVEAESEAEIRETLERDSWSASGLLAVQSVRPWTVLLRKQ